MNAQQPVSTTEKAAAPPSGESLAPRKSQLASGPGARSHRFVDRPHTYPHRCRSCSILFRGATGPLPVTTATAKVGKFTVYLDAIGTVTPVYTDTITAQVTGVITAVHYREGQFVSKGDFAD